MIPLPASCEVGVLARWAHDLQKPGSTDADYADFKELYPNAAAFVVTLATAVRALVEAKVREAVNDGLESTIPYNEYDTDEQANARAEAYIDSLVSRVLGGAS